MTWARVAWESRQWHVAVWRRVARPDVVPASRAIALNMPLLVTVVAVEVADVHFGEHGFRIDRLIRMGEMAMNGVVGLVLVHQIEDVGHRFRIGIVPYCVVIGEVILKWAKAGTVCSAQHECCQKLRTDGLCSSVLE